MKYNYDKIMIDTVESFGGVKKSLLLHSCCGPCSTACIERLKEFFNITVIYYNPNIEPLEEYLHRKREQIRLLKELDIPYIDVPYDNEVFVNNTKGLAQEREGGSRCSVCYGIRLKYTAQTAKVHNFDCFTTTLTVSPHKDSQIINAIGIAIGNEYSVPYLCADFKKRDGYLRSIELAKEYELYRQNYCGCLYSKRDENEE